MNLIRVGFEREGAEASLALRSADGRTIATLTAPVAAMAALIATMAVGIQADTADAYDLQIKGLLTIREKKPSTVRETKT